MSVLEIRKPYLLLIGDMQNPRNAKTAFGLVDWARADCIGQLRFGKDAVDVGLPDLSLQQAIAAGAKTLVIGIAPPGGQLSQDWYPTILDALASGLDVAAGLHTRLSSISAFVQSAATHGRKLHDVRQSDRQFAIGSGAPRTGRRVLTVGTDCALGKKYTALAIAKELRARGCDADFRATGQTGILIAGSGVAVDAVIADFIAGAAETLSPANRPDHWDVIEGQGSLFHPAYAGVTLGLLHGSQPDALVLCHDPARSALNGFPHIRVRSPVEAMPPYLDAARLTNQNARFVGVSLNTAALSDEEARAVIEANARETGLACCDPIRTGVADIVDALEAFDAG